MTEEGQSGENGLAIRIGNSEIIWMEPIHAKKGQILKLDLDNSNAVSIGP